MGLSSRNSDSGKRRGLHLMVTVTFNPNQLRAHLEPIHRLPAVERITLVSDVPGPTLPKLETVVPPRPLVRLLGRAGAKLVTCLVIARRQRPDWILAYNLVPHGINALLVGRFTDRPVMYHMIGGPIEWEEGGWRSDNKVLGRLPVPVRPLESLLLRVIRSCDIVATMGPHGRDVLIGRGIPPERIVILPAGVDETRFRRSRDGPRRYDLVTAGTFIPTKRTEDFLEAFARLRVDRRHLRAAVLGNGPLEENLREEARRLDVHDAVDFLGFRFDIENVFAQSEIFVLTSRYEGLSVALIEAMTCGLPAVVSDVGEARSLVRDGINGYVFPVGDVEALVARLAELLDDSAQRRRFGSAAADDAHALAGYGRIAEVYRRILVDSASGSPLRREAQRGDRSSAAG